MRPIWAVMLLAAFAHGESSVPVAGRICIEKTPSGAVRFRPPELVAWAGDQIHWFNDTSEPHDPGVWRKDGKFVSFLEEPVAAGSTSAVFSPFARIDKSNNQIAFTIQYSCRKHRNEKGVIQVIPTP